MPEGNGSGGENRSAEGDSSGALWRVIRAFFKGPDHDQSLRAQIEEAIEEHEHEPGYDEGADGDLVPVERQMLKNLLHFSERDADDVARSSPFPPRPALPRWSPPLPNMATVACRSMANRSMKCRA